MTERDDTVTLPPPPPPNPYAGPSGPPPPLPPAAYRPQPARPAGRGRFAAGVLVAALVVGGGAGVGGAATYDALSDDGGTATVRTTGTPISAGSSSNAPADPKLDGSVEAVAAKVLPSVVKINVSGPQGQGSGSGIILSADGRILTNNHVAEVAEGGGTLSVSFNDGSTAAATVLGTDPVTDTALIQAQGVSGLTPATIGSSSDLQIGQAVVAVGSPFGLEGTVTDGIVSALNRPVQVATNTTYPAIQTNAAINPGNSGGPLVNLSGDVVGINSSIRTADTGSDGSIGLGFAIPIDEVMPIVDQMANGDTPTHARLGVTVGDVADQSGATASIGAEIRTVNDGSTAAQAGIAAGDVITKVDDHLITGADSLVATIRSYRPGNQVTVTYTSGSDTKTTQLTLDSDADTSAS